MLNWLFREGGVKKVKSQKLKIKKLRKTKQRIEPEIEPEVNNMI